VVELVPTTYKQGVQGSIGALCFHNLTQQQREEGSKHVSRCQLLEAGFWLGFDPEDGGDMFLRNVCCFSTYHTAL
jgi:hypothetical protein